MPTDTSDQQITMPVDADTADNPVAFVNGVADIEPRLVRRYTDTADRTARMASLSENAMSTLATENRAEIYDGTNHVSLYTRSLFAMLYKTASQTMNVSSTALQDVTQLVVAMPTAGTFSFRAVIYYEAVAAGDIKVAFSTPAGVTFRFGGIGVITGGTSSGDANFLTVTGSDTPISYGGAGTGTVVNCQLEGEYVAGGTAGNLQFRAAQATSDPTAPIIIARSRIEVWRHI